MCMARHAIILATLFALTSLTLVFFSDEIAHIVSL